ncbi:MAG: hypothetical protein ABIB71_07880 [Candidatus Woesearchaeota archaeon]
MKTEELLKELNGIQTIKSVMTLLNVSKKKAVYYVHRLRKQGYVKTSMMSNKTRVYNISFENKAGGISYYDILNKHSPLKIASKKDYRVYGKKPSQEEALIFALKTKDLRTILTALALFKNISHWPELYRLSKKSNLKREVGALYDLARRIMRTKRMSRRFMNNSLPKKGDRCRYIIEGLSSKDFKDIEKRWRVYLPFNESDLEEYRKSKSGFRKKFLQWV